MREREKEEREKDRQRKGRNNRIKERGEKIENQYFNKTVHLIRSKF